MENLDEFWAKIERLTKGTNEVHFWRRPRYREVEVTKSNANWLVNDRATTEEAQLAVLMDLRDEEYRRKGGPQEAGRRLFLDDYSRQVELRCTAEQDCRDAWMWFWLVLAGGLLLAIVGFAGGYYFEMWRAVR